MTKTTQAAMDTHLLKDVTTLATAALITRTDGTKFRVTTSAEAITIDIGDGLGEQVYSASEGVARTNIQNDAELNVDNMDILGVFNNSVLDETELRRGLFDFADFKIFVFNHQDTSTSMGIIKIFRGQFGEVVITTQSTFRVTVRSLVQVYSKETGESYSKDCRADLGDIRCRVPLFPDPDNETDRTFPLSRILGSQAYQLGDFVTIPTVGQLDGCGQIIMNMEGTDGSTVFTNGGSQGDPDQEAGNVQIDTAQFFAGVSSCLFDGSGDILRWFDASWNDIGTNAFTMQARIRMGAIGASQNIFSKYEASTSDRVFRLEVNASNQIIFVWYLNGVSSAGSIVSTSTVALGGAFTHVAVTRDSAGDIRLFFNGVQEGGTVNETGSFHNSNERLRIGAIESGFVETFFFNGHIDNFEFINGSARWTANFTPPTGLLATGTPPLPWEDFGDRVYEITVAGTTDPCIEVPDETIGNTHTQGSATMKANHSWMRHAEVTAVDGGSPRRIFTVTELTPISGQAVGSNSLPSALGFPNDWFNGGAAFFESGVNDGRGKEVRDFTEGAGSQVVELFEDLPFDIEVGDKLRVFAGCDKTETTCVTKFNNAINAVAEWFVPGEDILGQYPDAR
jgi:hypothetical protein